MSGKIVETGELLITARQSVTLRDMVVTGTRKGFRAAVTIDNGRRRSTFNLDLKAGDPKYPNGLTIRRPTHPDIEEHLLPVR